MAKIYIADSRVETEKDRRLRKELSSRLVSLGHEILNFDEAGTDIELNLKRGLSNADVFLAFISESSFRSKIFYDELLQLRNYSVHSSNRLFLPVFSPDLNLDGVPQSIASIQGIRIGNPSLEEIFIAAGRIDEAINLFLGKKIATNEKAQEI